MYIYRDNNTALIGRVFYGLLDPRNRKRIYQISHLPFLHEPEKDSKYTVSNSSPSSNVHLHTNEVNDSEITILSHQRDDDDHASTGYIYFANFIIFNETLFILNNNVCVKYLVDTLLLAI